jgi:2-polyprenyl-6-methoxyphenol hydroxylase-like FAD-dependent oxidoreductase
MSRIIMLGGGVCGLASGIMLARDGHQVTILERDEAPVPECVEDAWERWSRHGVTQFRQPHYLQPGGRAVLDQEIPDVAGALEQAGALRFDALCMMPPLITDRAPPPGDERFVTVTARRPVLEQVLGRTAQEQPGVDIRRGAAGKRLSVQTYNGTPHVAGVHLVSGEELTSDLVVDAMGRRSQLPTWLKQAGAGALHEEASDSGFIYYTRFFRSSDGQTPIPRGPLLTAVGTFSVVTLPSDNGTWSVTVYISTGDQQLKRLRDPDRWTSVVAACPLQAHWLEGEPITGIMPMSGVIDRYRRMTTNGKPVATGLALLADAWSCTNPSLGRGITFGLLHAAMLREVVRIHLDDPHGFAQAWDRVTEERLTPWIRETIDENRARVRELDALRNGTQPADPAGPETGVQGALLAAMPHDPDLFRVFLESRCCIKPLHEALARPSLVKRILEVARARDRLPLPGPSREQLLQLLS